MQKMAILATLMDDGLRIHKTHRCPMSIGSAAVSKLRSECELPPILSASGLDRAYFELRLKCARWCG